jgi:hypothetical protein
MNVESAFARAEAQARTTKATYTVALRAWVRRLSGLQIEPTDQDIEDLHAEGLDAREGAQVLIDRVLTGYRTSA